MEDDPSLVLAVTTLLAGRGRLLDGPAPDDINSLSTFQSGLLYVDFTKAEINHNGYCHSLSERECRVLQFLVINRGVTVSRDTLLQYVWGYSKAPLTRTVDVTILRLRQKVESNPREPHFIVTVPGLGYRFNG